MRQFFTSPDVVGGESERKGDYHVATIYTVEVGKDVANLDGAILINNSRIIQVLNEAPVVERRFLQRPKGHQHTWINLVGLLRNIPNVADEIDDTNSSNRQFIWSGDGKITDLRDIMGRSEEIQYPPFGQYFTSTDALLEALEKTWRKLDSGAMSHGFPAKMHHFYRND